MWPKQFGAQVARIDSSESLKSPIVMAQPDSDLAIKAERADLAYSPTTGSCSLCLRGPPVSIPLESSHCCRCASDLAAPAVAADDAAWEDYILGMDSARGPEKVHEERSEQCIVTNLEVEGLVHEGLERPGSAVNLDADPQWKSIYVASSLDVASPREGDQDALMQRIESEFGSEFGSEYSDVFNNDIPSFKSSPEKVTNGRPAELLEPSEPAEPDSSSAVFPAMPLWPPAVHASSCDPPIDVRPPSRMASTPIHESRTTTPAADLGGIRVQSTFVANDYFKQVHRDPLAMSLQGRAGTSTRAQSQGTQGRPGEPPLRPTMAQTWPNEQFTRNLMDTATLEGIWAMLQEGDDRRAAASAALTGLSHRASASAQSSPAQSVLRRPHVCSVAG